MSPSATTGTSADPTREDDPVVVDHDDDDDDADADTKSRPMTAAPHQPSPQQLMISGTITTIVIRSISFIGTQYCIRTFHTPVTLGTNVQFELIMTAILFLSREGFRLAITNTTTNTTTTNSSSSSQLQLGGSGVALLTIPVTFFMSILALACHLYYCSTTTNNNQDGAHHDNNIHHDSYQMAGALYCVAAFLEGCGEPVVLYTLQHLSVTEKASAEGIATIVKTITTIIGMNPPRFSILQPLTTRSTGSLLPINDPLIVLGMAQIMYAITYCVVLYGTIYRRGHWRQVVPPMALWRRPTNHHTSTTIWWHTPTLRLVVLFTIQGILKFVLTEGDRIILSIVADNYNQGLYALGCAYGGLAARLLLQPLEETSRLLYSRLATTAATTKEKNGPKNSELSVLEVSYTVLVKMVLYIGLVFCCLGVNYTYVLLNVLAGRTWGNNPEAVGVLSGFCVYTAFLAWNGMTEAFVYGISQTAYDIGRLGIAHTATGGLFAVMAPVAVTRYGTIGLVTANCVTMLARTVFSLYFAARYFSHKEGQTISHTIVRLLRQMIPVPMILASFIIAFFGTQQSSHRMLATIEAENIVPASLPWFRLAIEHIGVGVTFGVGILSLAYALEKDFLLSIKRLWHEKKG